MIDFLKLNIAYIPENKLLANRQLEWKGSYNIETGENEYPIRAADHNLITSIRGPYKRELVGSIHKYHNIITKGKNENWDDFDHNLISETLNKLIDKYQLDPEKVIIENLEVGLNIVTSFDPKQILDKNLVCYNFKYPKSKNKSYNGSGKYCEFELSEMYIKLYDKGKHQSRKENILRYELKIIRSSKLKKIADISLLSDLFNKNKMNALLDYLYESFDSCLIVDDAGLAGSISADENDNQILTNGINPMYWANIKGMSKARAKSKFVELAEKYNLFTIKNEISLKLKKKGHELLECYKMNDFSNSNNTGEMLQNEHLIYVHSITSTKTAQHTYPDEIKHLHNDHPLKKKYRNKVSNPKHNFIRKLKKILDRDSLFPIHQYIKLTQEQINWLRGEDDILKRLGVE